MFRSFTHHGKNNPMLTPFEAGKNAERLGIDKSRKFVVVENPLFPRALFPTGTILTLDRDDGTTNPYFTDGKKKDVVSWCKLAYAPEPTPEVKKERNLVVVDDVVLEPSKEAPGYELPSDFHVEFAKKDYQPMVGDRVSVEGVVTYHNEQGRIVLNFADEVKEASWAMSFNPEEVAHLNLTLLSRPTPKRKITRKELEKLVGGEFEVVD